MKVQTLFLIAFFMFSCKPDELPEPFELTFNPDEAFLLSGTGQLLFFQNQWSDSYIQTYDYINNELLVQRPLTVLSTGLAFGVGNPNNSHEFYFYNGSDSFQIINLENMEVNEIDFGFSSSYDPIISNKQYIYYISFSSIKSYDRNTGKQKAYDVAFKGTIKSIEYNKSLNCIFGTVVSPTGLVKFELDDEGDIVNHIFKPFEDALANLIPNSSLAYYVEGGPNFMENGIKIINMEEWTIHALLDENNTSKTFETFVVDHNVLYAADDYYKLYSYSIDDNMNLLKVAPLRMRPKFMFVDDNNLLILIENSHLNNSCRIDKINLN